MNRKEYVHRCAAMRKLLGFITQFGSLRQFDPDRTWTQSTLPLRGSVAFSAPTEVFRLDLDRFKNIQYMTTAYQSSPAPAGAKFVP